MIAGILAIWIALAIIVRCCTKTRPYVDKRTGKIII